jgi:O-antigen/teichoic acid export membrane protein
MFQSSKLIQRVDKLIARQGQLGQALVKGVIGSAGLKIAHAGIGFVTAIVMAKMLGPSGYGTYAFVMALVAFLAIPSELGIPGLAVREIAVTHARKEWNRMRGFIIRAHQMIGLLSILLVVLALALATFLGSRLDPVKLKCMGLGLILVPLISLGSLRGAMLRGLRKVILGQLPEQVIRPLLLLALVIPLGLLGEKYATPLAVMIAQILATAGSFCCGMYLFIRNRPAELGSARPTFETSTWLRSALPFGMTAALQLVNGRTDILTLGFFRTDAEVGIYRVAVQMAALVIFGLQAVNAIQGPHIAHLYASGDKVRLQKMVTRSSQAVLLYALPVVLMIVLSGKWIIRTFFGPEFEAAYWPLVILCVGQLVNASIGSVASLLNMTGHERDTTRSIFIGATLNVALNLLLTPVWGMIGAAVATGVTLMTWNLVMWRKVHARIGIEASPFFRGFR